MTGVGSARDDTPFLGIGDGTDVVVAELYQHEVTWLQGIIHPLPSAFTQIAACAASSHRHVLPSDLCWVEDDACLRTPAPHAVLILILVLYSRVTSDEYHRLPCLTTFAVGWQFHACHHLLQRFQGRIVRVINTLSGTAGIHLRTKGRSVYMVTEEVVLFLPMAVTVEFRT